MGKSTRESAAAAPSTLRPIAFFIPGLNGGGAQRVFVTLVNTLVDLTDRPIHLVTSREGGEFEGLIDERVVRVSLGHKHVSRSVLSLARYIRMARPEGMISTLNYCNVIFLLSAILARVPVRRVIREANVLQEDFGSGASKKQAALLRILMRLLYRHADELIIITKDVERSLTRHRIAPLGRIHRIPNPVNVETATDAPSEFEAPPRARFVLAIGRISYQKGFDILVRAFAQVKDLDIFLVILGGGDTKELESLAEQLGVAERVVFKGFVPNPVEYLQAASLFVLSSRWEGFSNALAEALAVGCPIVAVDCPGSSREVLDNGRLGRLAPAGDPAALAKAMTEELDSPSASLEARKLWARQYAPEEIGKRYLEVLTRQS